MTGKDMAGQCHIYKEKLIFPINTNGELDRIFLLIKLLFALIMKMVPSTGSIAQRPGNIDVSSIKKKLAPRNKNPNTDRELCEMLNKYFDENLADPIIARDPPSNNSQNLECGR